MSKKAILQFVGKRIRTFRNSISVSQEELGHLCGLDRTYISGIERGLRNVSLLNIESIARSLDVSIAELFAGYGETTKLNTIAQDYLIRPNFEINCGFHVTSVQIHQAIQLTTQTLAGLPDILFSSIDLKATSGMVGALFISSLAEQVVDAIPNPIEKGYPDLIPIAGLKASEKELRNYGKGLEVKCTVGNVITGSQLQSGDMRIQYLSQLTWQAHHREVDSLLGLVWDFAGEEYNGRYKPIITGAFYASNLIQDDWGAISGTEGRNTKVTGMKASGKRKMGAGWVVLLNSAEYLQKYQKKLKFSV